MSARRFRCLYTSAEAFDILNKDSDASDSEIQDQSFESDEAVSVQSLVESDDNSSDEEEVAAVPFQQLQQRQYSVAWIL